MPARILTKIILLIALPVLIFAAFLAASNSGVLSRQIPGANAKGKANVTCVYFFMRGFRNEAAILPACPHQITMKDLDAQTH